MRNNLLRFVAICFMACHAHGFSPEQPLAERAHEQVAQASFHALRCVVCDGQSLAESDATLARQMRAEIRRMASEGKSAADIADYFQERYGDSVLMRPPFAPHTYLLWALPLLLLGLGVWILRRRG